MSKSKINEKECIMKCAEVMYSAHEMMDIGEHLDANVYSAIAMLFVNPVFNRIGNSIPEAKVFEYADISLEEAQEAFRGVQSIFSLGETISGYTGIHPDVDVDRICTRYPDGSVLVYWDIIEEGNKNDRNLDDYEFFLNMEEFYEAYGKPNNG